jgi:predicted nucleotidyltransferase component of viral defense system
MTPLTRRDILTHQAHVPWPSQRQVEQDLVLCRSMAAIFNDKFLHGQVAMRGGTLLHKVHLAPPCRYSEDIDLVVFGSRPEQHIRRALARVLEPVLGGPRSSVWDSLRLAIRNTVRPSRVLRMTYLIPSVSEPALPLEIIVEANVTERKPHLPIVELPFEFTFAGERVQTRVNGYDIHEMLGTKLRALFQRRRGRDLFDLYWALTQAQPPVRPEKIVQCFLYYLEREGSVAGRAEFVGILRSHLTDAGFCSDMNQLLRVGVAYDPKTAGECLEHQLLRLLSE